MKEGTDVAGWVDGSDGLAGTQTEGERSLGLLNDGAGLIIYFLPTLGHEQNHPHHLSQPSISSLWDS